MDIYEVFKKLNIEYNEIEHKPLYTILDAEVIKGRIEGQECKNLFLTDNKDGYYLVIIEDKKRVDLKQLQKLLNVSKLSFASAGKLKEILNLIPGSVTPLSIIYDTNNKVTLLIDNDLKNKMLLFHPNTNTKTVSIKYNDLIKFIEFEKHKYIFI